MESYLGESWSFTMNNGPMDHNPYPTTVFLPDECPACGGMNDNCSHHAGVTVDRFETDNTIWQADGPEVQNTAVNLNHFTDPVNSQQPIDFFAQAQMGRYVDINQFAALRLDQRQPPDIELSIQGAYNPGDKTSVPLTDPTTQNGMQPYVPDFQLPNGNISQARNDAFSVYSDPLPQPMKKKPTWAEITELSLDTRQQLLNGIDPRYLSPQTDSGVNPFQQNGSPSEPTPASPVLKKKAPRLEMSMRNESMRTSRRATNGNSSRRASSPGARSVTSRVSSASRRGRGRKASYSKHLHPEDAHLPLSFLSCSTCERSFQNKSELHHHMLIHRDRDFVCDVCGAGFIWNKDLVRHMPKHTKEKPYKCENCPKSFTRHDNLRRHYGTDHPRLTVPSCSSRNDSGTVNSSQS